MASFIVLQLLMVLSAVIERNPEIHYKLCLDLNQVGLSLYCNRAVKGGRLRKLGPRKQRTPFLDSGSLLPPSSQVSLSNPYVFIIFLYNL